MGLVGERTGSFSGMENFRCRVDFIVVFLVWGNVEGFSGL